MTGHEIPDGTYTAVIDRFEDTLAVLEVSGDDERYEVAVDDSELPDDDQHVDAVLHISFVDGMLEDIEYNPEETEERAEAAQDRFDRLSSRAPDDDE